MPDYIKKVKAKAVIVTNAAKVSGKIRCVYADNIIHAKRYSLMFPRGCDEK